MVYRPLLATPVFPRACKHVHPHPLTPTLPYRSLDTELIYARPQNHKDTQCSRRCASLSLTFYHN